MSTMLIHGGTVVNADGRQAANVLVEDGRVSALLDHRDRPGAETVVDATGKLVLPGAFDPHVHIGYMGALDEQCEQDTRAAVLGGTTSMQVFINVPDGSRFKEITTAFDANSYLDYAISPIIRSATDAQVIDEAITDWGVTSFKFFMAYRAAAGASLIPGAPVNNLNDGLMVDIFERLAGFRAEGNHVIACIHAENYEITEWFLEKVRASGRAGLRAWHEASPGFAEAENAMRASYFGEVTGCPVYVVHLGSTESARVMRRVRSQQGDVHAETCPHYLARTCDDPIGNLGKISPPIRPEEHRLDTWAALADGVYECVGTDNTSASLAAKGGDIWEAARGIPGCGTMLPVLLSEGVNKDRISLEQLVSVSSANAARIFGFGDRKGRVSPGADADIAVVDLDLTRTVDHEQLGHYSDYGIYDGMQLTGWPVATIARGELVAEHFQVVGRPSATLLRRTGETAHGRRPEIRG